MNKEQVNVITQYFRDHEKTRDDFKVGVEFEYFIVRRDTLEAVTYEDIRHTLQLLESKGYKGIYEQEYLLGLKSEYFTITLEPGAQFEISIVRQKEIVELENIYFAFLDDILPILNAKNQCLIASGYQPLSKIENIKMIPKSRYSYMYDYFKQKGKHAHHMMKGSASIQICLDYGSESDYKKKFLIANLLSPVFYAFFDNSPIFEGQVYDKESLRRTIWAHCDDARSGVVDQLLDGSFGYNEYAQYILNHPPIFIFDGVNTTLTYDQLFKDFFDPEKTTTPELEHVLSMVFPDVRTKGYIELRMIDSMPYPFNFAVVALIKGLFYSEVNLEVVYEFVRTISKEAFIRLQQDITDQGIHATVNGQTVLEVMKWLVNLAKNELRIDELHYIEPICDLIVKEKTLSQLMKAKLTEGNTLCDILLKNEVMACTIKG